MIDLNQAFSGMSVEANARVTWTLPKNLPYFDGHFPDNPIFPAVGIVDASLHALARIVGHHVELESIPTAKFTHVLQPEVPVEMNFEKVGANSWTVDWTVAASGEAVATLSLRLRADA